jgi:hypothetical protein
VARFEERAAGGQNCRTGTSETAALGLVWLFLLFFAAKYQSSFHLVWSPSTGHRASQIDKKTKIMAILLLIVRQQRGVLFPAILSKAEFVTCSTCLIRSRSGSVLP